jgi:ABC-type branched-subunit amino acid transport system ATPase component
MLTTLKIQSFRGIRNLTIDDLGLVNIFIGSNGAGKTCILEAASIAANPVNAAWLNQLSVWRELPPFSLESSDGLRSFFYGLSSETPIHLEWEAGELSGRLKIQGQSGTDYVATTDAVSVSGSASSSNSMNERIGGAEIEYRTKADVVVRFKLTLVPNGFQIVSINQSQTPPPQVKTLSAFFVHARRSSSLGETAKMLTIAAEQKTDESIILRAVQKVDSRVLRLIPGYREKGPVILADVGLPRLIPTNVLGDGFSRILLMVTGAVLERSNLLLVDDIDSGLHHSVMESFWLSLIELQKARKFQLFCTTHSEEMLRSTLGAFEGVPGALRVFRVDQRGSDTFLQKYTFDTLRSASFAGMDVR